MSKRRSVIQDAEAVAKAEARRQRVERLRLAFVRLQQGVHGPVVSRPSAVEIGRAKMGEGGNVEHPKGTSHGN